LLSSSRTEEPAYTPQQYSFEDFSKNTSMAGGSFLPDASKLLVCSNETGIFKAVALPPSRH